jgi:5,10-methylenetetrahydromethanopterin reductase
MAVWALGSERLKLATGVTNSLSRHIATTAAAIASIQTISKGRAVLGIGRGDSALAYLGYAPDTLKAFRASLDNLQDLLSGCPVEFGRAGMTLDAPSLDTMSLGGRPDKSGLKWLPKDLAKVPLDVAATGPKVIEMAATVAEYITFSVGAIPERLQWALNMANAARQRAGLNRSHMNYGAQVILACHTDRDVMRRFAMQATTALARFQVMMGSGTAAGPLSESDKRDLKSIHDGYDMNHHADLETKDWLVDNAISWDFVERFAIFGTPEHCTERLIELAKLGIERFVIMGPGLYPETRVDDKTLFAREVMPAVRAALT